MALTLEGIARAAFRMVIPSYSAMGWSMNAMIRRAQAVGLSYRRQLMLNDIRAVMGLMKGERLIAGVAREVKFPKNRMIEASLSRDYKYRVHGLATYQNEFTGVESSNRVSFYTDSWLSLDQWQADFAAGLADYEYEEGVTLTKIDFKSVEHNEGTPY